ncbi:hypothetical protein [Limimaricola pyoseonensis]|uniref:Pyridoxamine 5'-phosphate oxidase n=1 Tax=Limimaricola pyoseonensis TaxID=521013 RepID=A0A1G7IH49_9RHOB|nr:hypothetical protein [Limimaricola pyoseonensis]SDF11955.1 hypothetical protein SAMN04488567_3464 [Limimaricola pyoseonensis]
MPSAGAPADPIAAEPGLLPEAQALVEAFCQHGASIILGVTGLLDRPLAGVALGCTVIGPERVRVLLSRPSNSELLLGLMRDSRIALTVSEVPTHRSIQIKGDGAVLLAAQPEDLRVATRQLRAFRDQLIDAEYGEAFATAYCSFDPTEAVAVEFVPCAAFTQTPGPKAGERLEEAAR